MGSICFAATFVLFSAIRLLLLFGNGVHHGESDKQMVGCVASGV